MAVAFVTQNGKGLGHLVRTRLLCDHLRSHGVRPVVFAQGTNLELYFPDDPVRCIPHLWKLGTEEERGISHEIADFARLSDPAIVLEDTHPIDCVMPGDVHRVLILRPTTFGNILELIGNEKLRFSKVFVADHPQSPTWPYSEREWDTIQRAWDVVPLGPIFTRVSADALREASQWVGREPFCVISAGGGGQIAGRADLPRFIERAGEVAERILRKRKMRFLFVKGPFFPMSIAIPELFSPIDETSLMPALFALADGAIIRPGFNSLWECLAGLTPIYPVKGETYEEPVAARQRALSLAGLLTDTPESDWWNPSWRSAFEATLKPVVARWPGFPMDRRLADFVRQVAAGEPSAVEARRRILLVSINGVGMGHVARMTRLGRHLLTGGAEVHLAVETAAESLLGEASIPRTILPEWPYERTSFARYLPKLRILLETLDPDTVIFDRHYPLPKGLATIPELIFREKVAIASLPSPSLLASLMANTDMDHTYLLHAAPEFEALYGDALTRLVSASDRVAFAGGPILDRQAVVDGVSLKVPEVPYALFVLGGGGEHEGIHDTETIAGLASDLAFHLRREHELLMVFIHGPYFRHRDMLGPDCRFAYRAANNLETLIRKARLTVFRPGFNLSREVYATARSYVALDTYQSEEATNAHLRFLAERDGARVSKLEFRELIDCVDSLLREEPADLPRVPWRNSTPVLVKRLLQEDQGIWRRAAGAFSTLKDKGCVLVRIDDVTSKNSHLQWLIGALAQRHIPASLEVVPMLADLPESWLASFDPDSSLFEVSQHGCWHLNIQDVGEHYGEFSHPITPEIDIALRRLREGKARLEARYGSRFRGGFSAPFDNLPAWLPTAWETIGGRYISLCAAEPVECNIPYAIVRPDLWCWQPSRPRSLAAILGGLYGGIVERGNAGLVFHPRTIDRNFRTKVEALLDFLGEMGVPFRLISECAQRPGERCMRALLHRRHAGLEQFA